MDYGLSHRGIWKLKKESSQYKPWTTDYELRTTEIGLWTVMQGAGVHKKPFCGPNGVVQIGHPSVPSGKLLVASQNEMS